MKNSFQDFVIEFMKETGVAFKLYGSNRSLDREILYAGPNNNVVISFAIDGIIHIASRYPKPGDPMQREMSIELDFADPNVTPDKVRKAIDIIRNKVREY